MAYGSTQQNYAGPVNSGDMIVKNNQASPGIAALLRKQNMKGAQGIFQLPDTQQANPDFYNQSLMNVQNEIQGQTQTLNAMAPEGESLAYINEQEAGILKLLGGAGVPVNATGIPSFFLGYTGKKKSTGVPGSGGSQDTNKNYTGSYSRSGRKDPPKSGTEMINELDNLMNNNANNTSSSGDNKEEQSILQKIFKVNPEVKALADTIRAKVKEVENDPNLSNYKKQQLIKQLKFAKSGGKSNFGMADRVGFAVENVDAQRRGSVDLGIQDLINLGYKDDDLKKAQKLIETYGRAVVIDQNTGQIKISQPTIREVGGDIKRRLTKDMEGFPSINPLGLLMKGFSKKTDVEDSEEDMGAEEKSDFQKEIDRLLMTAEQPNNNRAKYSFQPNDKGAMNAQFGNTTDKYAQADFFNTVMNRNNDTRTQQEREYQLDQQRQIGADLNRAMNPRDNQPSVVSNTGSTTEEDGNDDDAPYDYFDYQRQFQSPMAFQDLIDRAYTSDPDRKNMLESFADMFARIKKDNA